MTKINDLKEFLAWRGFGENEAGYWARCFYKYTPCGPWAVFLVEGEPEQVIHHPEQVAKVADHKGRAILENAEDLSADFIQLLGFDEYGLSKKEREWTTYVDLVEDYLRDPDRDRWDIQVTHSAERMEVTLPAWEERIPATYGEVYYEDLWGGKVTNENCVGIKFGSIVEGSEACSGPFEHFFPFESDEFARDEEYMEGETSFYWERDNADWYRVQTDDDDWVVINSWGDIEWKDGPPPEPLKGLVEKAIEDDFYEDPDNSSFLRHRIPVVPGYWATPKKEWKPMPLGYDGATIHRFINDDVF